MSVLNYVLHTALPDLWARFFCPEDIERHRRTSFMPENPTTDIMHGDLECRYTFPWFDGRTVPFWNFPWTIANRETKPADYKLLFTDLNENEVTEGQKSLRKVEESFKLASQEAGKEEIIMLNSACVPDLTGEDPTPFLAKYGQNVKALYRASDGRDVAYSTTDEIFQKSQMDTAALEGGAVAPEPYTVNLLGYPNGRARQEFISLLKNAGIQVAACVVPSLGFESLRIARTAALNIVMEHCLYQNEARDFLARFSQPSLIPPAPYGMENSRLWLESVSRKVGRFEEGAACWENVRQSIGPDFSHWKKEAQKYSLAFVLSPKQIPQILDSRRTLGIPVFAILKEMGFSLEFLVFAKNGAGKNIQLPASTSVQFFSSEEELTSLLAQGTFQAVYSDYFFDRRISRVGKAQFSLSVFEAGPWGALRTLERLVGICKLPFYKKYHRYLKTGGRE